MLLWRLADYSYVGRSTDSQTNANPSTAILNRTTTAGNAAIAAALFDARDTGTASAGGGLDTLDTNTYYNSRNHVGCSANDLAGGSPETLSVNYSNSYKNGCGLLMEYAPSTAPIYGNTDFSGVAGYYSATGGVGRAVAWKIPVSNGTYAVSDITAALFRTDQGYREFVFALADHDSVNDRPDIIRASTNRRQGSNAGYAEVTIAISGSITITDGIMWLIVALESGSSSRTYYNTGTGERTLEVSISASEAISKFEAGDRWDALANVASPNVQTTRRSLVKFTAVLS